MDIKTNSFKAWLQAARPKTLSGAAVPVMIGTAFAWKTAGPQNFRIFPAVLCFLFAFIMQIDANFINDYFDCVKGNDDITTRLGPKRACTEGWITLPVMRRGIIITTSVACIIGLPLIYYGGPKMVIIGFICVIFCFLYTTKLSYLGLGDLLVLVFFGIIPVSLTYYVIVPEEEQHITSPVFLASLGCGLVIDTLLIINNFRDRENDKEADKITLVVRIGEKWGYNLYKIVGSTGYILTLIALFLEGMQGAKALLIVALCLQIPFAILNDIAFRKMGKIWEGKELNKILGLTARNMFIYGLFSTIGIIILSF